MEEERKYEFDSAFQTKLAALALRDTNFLQRVDGLVLPAYFENHFEAFFVDLALRYYKKYGRAPSIGILTTLVTEAGAEGRIRREEIAEVKAACTKLCAQGLEDRDFAIDQVASFAKNRAVEAAILKSVSLLERGNFDQIQKEMQLALQVGANEDLGCYDYLATIEDRTEERLRISEGKFEYTGISSGYDEIDRELYNRGWGRKELSIIMGCAKSGKTLALGDFSKNAAILGKKVLYLTLEVAAKILAERIDSNIAGIAMKQLNMRPLEVAEKLRMVQARAKGQLLIHEYPSNGLKCSMLRRLLERYRLRGIQFDMVVIDYIDLLAPERPADDLYTAMKGICSDVRAIGQEYDCAILSATQSNRSGAAATTVKATDVSDSYEKIRIADLVLSINQTDEERDRGECRLYWAASRNSEAEFTLRLQQDRAKGRFISKVIGRE